MNRASKETGFYECILPRLFFNGRLESWRNSNQTKFNYRCVYGVMVACNPSKVRVGVQIPLDALIEILKKDGYYVS